MVEFEYLRLRCQGSSRSRYQAGMFGGEGGGGGGKGKGEGEEGRGRGRGRREGEGGGGKGKGKGKAEGEREIKGKEWKRQSEVIQLHKPKIKLKYPEAIWICLLSFCGRQIEKTVLQI